MLCIATEYKPMLTSCTLQNCKNSDYGDKEEAHTDAQRVAFTLLSDRVFAVYSDSQAAHEQKSREESKQRAR